MAKKDSLGDRMKEYYENRAKTYLVRRMPVIIRLDGCHFLTKIDALYIYIQTNIL